MASCNALPSHPPRIMNALSSATSATTTTTLISSAPSTDTNITTTPSPPPTPEQTSKNCSETLSNSTISSNDIASSCPSSSSPSSSSQPRTYITDPSTSTSATMVNASPINMSSTASLQQQQQPVPQPFNLINHPIKDTLNIVSALLSKVVQKNDSQYDPSNGSSVTLFHSRAVPRISIEAYLTRILQYIPFTNETLLNVLVYFDRIGGLEGMQLQPNGTMASTTDTCQKSTSSLIVSLMEKEDLEVHIKSPSSSVIGPNAGIPVVRKHGREEDSSCQPQNCKKRARTDEMSTLSPSVSPAVEISLPQTPAATPPAPPCTAATDNGFRLNSFNIHRLLITCLMVAAKFTSDLFYSNARYAK
ncbi:hypothetical protein BX616_006430, partial [Lobosporangium transversale]